MFREEVGEVLVGAHEGDADGVLCTILRSDSVTVEARSRGASSRFDCSASFAVHAEVREADAPTSSCTCLSVQPPISLRTTAAHLRARRSVLRTSLAFSATACSSPALARFFGRPIVRAQRRGAGLWGGVTCRGSQVIS